MTSGFKGNHLVIAVETSLQRELQSALFSILPDCEMP